VQNDEFVPLAIYWFGDIIMVAYFVLSAILLINLLIAMMSTTYNNLMGDTRRTQGEWRVEFGDHLLHYERFLIIPPPLNLIQFMFFLIALVGQYKSKKYQEFLFGDWNSRDRAISRLYRDKFKDVKHTEDVKKRELKKIGNLIRQKEESIWNTIKELIQVYGNDELSKPKDKDIRMTRSRRTSDIQIIDDGNRDQPMKKEEEQEPVDEESEHVPLDDPTAYSGEEQPSEGDEQPTVPDPEYSDGD